MIRVPIKLYYTNGVLDLSKCTELKHINYLAFDNCSKFTHAIFPNSTENDLHTESKLEVGWVHNKYNSGTNNWRGRIFKNDGPTILVGESVYQADTNLANYYSSDEHYYAGWNGNNKTYYFALSSSDLYIAENATQRYWTNVGYNYICFDGYEAAQHYFANSPSIPS